MRSSGACERDNGNPITRVSNSESSLECANNYSMMIDCDIAVIGNDVNGVSPVSRIDDFSCDSSDRIENIPSYELDCSIMLEGGRTEVQEAADINSCNKDTAQFASDATGTLIPSAACEDGPSVMRPRSKYIYNIDGIIKEHTTVSPINSLDDSCCDLSYIIENTSSFERGYSKTLEDIMTEIQKIGDLHDCNKDSTQFTSTATGTY
jgi:hypothetical protein